MEHFSINNALNKEHILCSPIIENINESDKTQLEVLKKDVNTYTILLMVPVVCIFLLPIVLYFSFDPENLFLIPIITIFQLVTVFIFFRLRKKIKHRYDSAKIDFDLNKKEVYHAISLSSSFYDSSENSGSTYKVKLEGFAIDAIIHEKELPQLAESKFIVERLPKSGIIIKIKNTKVN